MGGAEPQGICRAGQTVLARVMEFQVWYPPAGSVALRGESLEKGQWTLPALLSERKLLLPSLSLMLGS